MNSVPAEAIEKEIFARLGKIIRDTTELEAAVRASIASIPDQANKLHDEKELLLTKIAKAQRILANALEVLFEQKGTPAAIPAQKKVDEQNLVIAAAEARVTEIDSLLNRVQIPADFADRFKQA